MKRNSICLLFIILLLGSQVFGTNQTGGGYYLQPSPEVEVTGRVVGSDFPDIGIANAEVTLTGMGTHTGITDEDGYFMIDTVNSDNTYEIVIEAEGYQVYTGEAVIGADDTDLGDIIINEIVFPAYDVIAAQNEYETLAEIIWHSPEQGLVEDYRLYRLLLGDEENEENWIMVAEGISDTVYNDLSWEIVEMGVYRYAVKAEYLNNVLSEAAFSNWLGKDMLATLEVTLTTNIGDIPEGAIITLEATEPDPDGNYPEYEAVTDESGHCTITDIWKGNYDLTAELAGFVVLEDNIDILENIDYSAMLVELLYPAYDVVVNENHDGNAWLIWHSAVIQPLFGYNIYRGFADDQAYYEDWDLIVETVLDTTYEDITWQEVTVPGEYMYCVRVTYEGGVLSDPAFSNIISFDISVPVTIIISSDSGNSVDGAEVNLCNLDGNHNYEGIVQDGMVYWEEVWMGIYELDVSFPGYELYQETDLIIMECLVLDVELEEIINPPVNLEYDAATGLLSWEPPLIDGEPYSSMPVRHLEYYYIYLDNELIAQTTDIEINMCSYIYPGFEYIAGVSAYYSSDNESEIIEILIPNLDSDENNISPLETCLNGNYPNPFNPVTTIEYQLVEAGNVKLEVFNVKGQKVSMLINEQQDAENHSFRWNAYDMNSGIYFIRLTSGEYQKTSKVVLLK